VKVFVAGATGAVGRPLTRRLVAEGHAVTGLTRSQDRADALRAQGAEAAVADVHDAEAVTAVVTAAQPEVLVHQLTALPAHMDMKDLDGFYRETNRLRREGTPVLVDAARAAGARRVIAQSIAFIYAQEGSRVKDEDAPLVQDPPGAFGTAFDAVMALERTVLDAEGIEGVVQRYGWFYGPGTYYAPGGDQHEAFRKRRTPIVGSGQSTWSFCHVEDAASAVVAALGEGPTGVYNVCDDEPAPTREWMPAYAEAIGAKPPRRVPRFMARLAAPKEIVAMATELRGADNGRFKRDYGWAPRYASWRQGFREGPG
jgi:nucleoside-diphosphate-sugar epimerase